MAEVMQSATEADAVAAVTEAVLPELRELEPDAGSRALGPKSLLADVPVTGDGARVRWPPRCAANALAEPVTVTDSRNSV